MNESRQPGRESKTILFLCTGNYYRSRFAAILFNAYAGRAGLDWWAESRGIALEFGVRNVGPISVLALDGLRDRGIRLEEPFRFPLHVREEDMDAADAIIALKEDEHRLVIEDRFDLWRDKVGYWHINDLDVDPPEKAMAAIEVEVVKLVQRLYQELSTQSDTEETRRDTERGTELHRVGLCVERGGSYGGQDGSSIA